MGASTAGPVRGRRATPPARRRSRALAAAFLFFVVFVGAYESRLPHFVVKRGDDKGRLPRSSAVEEGLLHELF